MLTIVITTAIATIDLVVIVAVAAAAAEYLCFWGLSLLFAPSLILIWWIIFHKNFTLKCTHQRKRVQHAAVFGYVSFDEIAFVCMCESVYYASW